MKKLGEAIGKFVVKHRILIVIASILLCIPSLFGYINTDINYDILVYLPEDIDTMKGQDILAEDFDMGSFAMCVVDNMSSKDVLDLEEKYKDISSIELLKHVGKLLEQHNYIIGNIDATIIAQKPKMAPHIPNMRENIATALNISIDQINVKATTEEGLGFTGEGLGISSQSICLIEKNK